LEVVMFVQTPPTYFQVWFDIPKLLVPPNRTTYPSRASYVIWLIQLPVGVPDGESLVQVPATAGRGAPHAFEEVEGPAEQPWVGEPEGAEARARAAVAAAIWVAASWESRSWDSVRSEGADGAGAVDPKWTPDGRAIRATTNTGAMVQRRRHRP